MEVLQSFLSLNLKKATPSSTKSDKNVAEASTVVKVSLIGLGATLGASIGDGRGSHLGDIRLLNKKSRHSECIAYETMTLLTGLVDR